MQSNKLRNHIPIAAPARRSAADGSESDLRVSLGFEPRWFYERCDVDFSEKWHKDPHYRHRTLVEMKDLLTEKFPSTDYWDEEEYKDGLWTISGCYGAYVIPKAFGFDLKYEPDRWPDLAKENEKLSLEEMREVTVEDFLATPLMDDIFEQMEVIEKEGGKIPGYLNWQGVLNNAFHLRGEKIFTDFYTNGEAAHHLLSVIAEAMIALAQQVQERQRESGFYVDHFVVSNCTVNMISPETYKEFIYPYDKKIGGEFERFGVHTCNWDVTPYLDELRELPQVGYLDMGMNSDMVQAKAKFPRARRAVLYSPEKLDQAPLEKIEEDMGKIYEDLGPCDLVMADIKSDTPDERVRELLRICRELRR